MQVSEHLAAYHRRGEPTAPTPATPTNGSKGISASTPMPAEAGLSPVMEEVANANGLGGASGGEGGTRSNCSSLGTRECAEKLPQVDWRTLLGWPATPTAPTSTTAADGSKFTPTAAEAGLSPPGAPTEGGSSSGYEAQGREVMRLDEASGGEGGARSDCSSLRTRECAGGVVVGDGEPKAVPQSKPREPQPPAPSSSPSMPPAPTSRSGLTPTAPTSTTATNGSTFTSMPPAPTSRAGLTPPGPTPAILPSSATPSPFNDETPLLSNAASGRKRAAVQPPPPPPAPTSRSGLTAADLESNVLAQSKSSQPPALSPRQPGGNVGGEQGVKGDSQTDRKNPGGGAQTDRQNPTSRSGLTAADLESNLLAQSKRRKLASLSAAPAAAKNTPPPPPHPVPPPRTHRSPRHPPHPPAPPPPTIRPPRPALRISTFRRGRAEQARQGGRERWGWLSDGQEKSGRVPEAGAEKAEGPREELPIR